MRSKPLHLRLPATSANLGPGFDTLGLALDFALEITAGAADTFTIHATGRNPEVCGATSRNLMLDVYRKTLTAEGRAVMPLALEVANGIPLGMGCGSSAAVRLAGVALAAHFGELGWSRDRILTEAVRLEGHPDNAAPCWLGGFVAGCWDGRELSTVKLTPPSAWRALVVLPERPLATTASRAVLPESYSRADVVYNLQRVAVLTAAFAAGRADALAEAMRDRLHQPYRDVVCPLLPKLLPLSGVEGVLGVALSGAGSAVLVLVESAGHAATAEARIRAILDQTETFEILRSNLNGSEARMEVTNKVPR